MMCRHWLAILGLAIAGQSLGQVVYPPPPAHYDVEVRYRIRATRNERIAQYMDMIRALDQAGLKREIDEDDDAITDPNAERLRGKIPSSAVPSLLAEEHVHSVLLKPAGFQTPEGPEPVTIRVTLPHGLARDRQQLLHSQVGERLAILGYVSRIGYDHRGFTRHFGTIPAENLPTLLADLRYQPGGWLTSERNADELPEPLRNFDPLRVIEVIAEPNEIGAMREATSPAIAAGTEKFSPELRALLKQEGAAAKPTRLEVVLFEPLNPGITSWRSWLRSAGTITIEGQLGQIVTVLAPARVAMQLAALPQVASVRLPARATDPIPLANSIASNHALSLSHVDQLHQQNVRGQGVTVAIIDSDFDGVKRFLGGSLRADTVLLDLTAERNPSFEPDPIGNDRPGRGTLAALAAARAAPQAHLVLIRVDAAAAYQVGNIARFISGDSFRTEAMLVRHAELTLDNEQLRQARESLNEERRLMSENFDSADATNAKRLDLQKRLADQLKRENDFSNRLDRFAKLERHLLDLRSVSVVACNLSWNSGFPIDGTGPLAQFFDGPARLHDRGAGLGPVTWLQSAGDTNGQTWAGPTWDMDGNGVLEFAQPTSPLPSAKWSRELNFLGWQPNEGNWNSDMPAGTPIRLCLQWTEAHDLRAPVPLDRYRIPLNDLRPIIVRQRDPNGQQTSTDDLVVVARTVGMPQLIGRTSSSATFEHTIELMIDQPGRFAVRLEAAISPSTSPSEIPLPPAARQQSEVFPRLFVAAPTSDKGRPVFIDFRSIAGGVATPGDAHSVVVVGAARQDGQPQPYSAHGSAPSLALSARPSFLSYDELMLGNLASRGTATANGFSSGIVAAMLSGGGPSSYQLTWLNLHTDAVLQVPELWLEQRKNWTASPHGAAYPSSHEVPRSPHNR